MADLATLVPATGEPDGPVAGPMTDLTPAGAAALDAVDPLAGFREAFVHDDADPDLIFLADTKCCAQTAAAIAERPSWETLTAVSTGRIVELDDDVASRWGPRIVDFLRAIVDAVNSVE